MKGGDTQQASPVNRCFHKQRPDGWVVCVHPQKPKVCPGETVLASTLTKDLPPWLKEVPTAHEMVEEMIYDYGCVIWI